MDHVMHPQYQRVKQRVFEILHEEFQKPGDKLGKLVVRSLTLLIALNVVAIVLESIHDLHVEYAEFFEYFDIISISVFTIEYVLGVWTANCDPKYRGTFKGRLRYMLSLFAIIDFLAILPFYLQSLLHFYIDLRILRIVRVFRIFHLFTLGHYTEALKTIGQVIKEKKEALIMTLFIGFIILLFSAFLIQFFETTEGAPATDIFRDLFTTMYWVGITLAHVRHGNLYPVTPGGMAVASLVEVLGIMFIILPTGIIASGFITHLKHRSPEGQLQHIKEAHPLHGREPDILPIPKNRYQRIQKRVHSILDSKDTNDKFGHVISISLMCLIITNIATIMLETNAEFYVQYYAFLYTFEAVSAIIFSIEYVLRVWSCLWSGNPRHKSPVKGRIWYMLHPLSIFDFLAILPFYLPAFLPFNLLFLRVLRLFRFFRVFKFGRYSASLDHMAKVFSRSKEALGVSIFIGVIFLVFNATIIQHFEYEVQPDQFPDIPSTIMWLIMTYTASNGAAVPMTFIGRLFSVVSGFLSMALLALPTGILGAAFIEQIKSPVQSPATVVQEPHPDDAIPGNERGK
jgi:voltage-gated potassium channel